MTWYEYVIAKLNNHEERLKRIEERLAKIDSQPAQQSPWAPDWNPPPQPGA